MTEPLTREQVDNLIKHLDYASEIDEKPAKASLLALFEENAALRQQLEAAQRKRDEQGRNACQLFDTVKDLQAQLAQQARRTDELEAHLKQAGEWVRERQ